MSTPRPAGVLSIVSSVGAQGGTPTWMARHQHRRFRHHLLAVDITDTAFARLTAGDAGEAWHLDPFLDRGAWAQFIMEFVASREIDVLQVVMACIGVDLVPALRAAYPTIRIVVDTEGESGCGQAWLTYVVSRYGNVIDAFCAPDPERAATAQALGVSASRIHLYDAARGDGAVAAWHEDVYGLLLADPVG